MIFMSRTTFAQDPSLILILLYDYWEWDLYYMFRLFSLTRFCCMEQIEWSYFVLPSSRRLGSDAPSRNNGWGSFDQHELTPFVESGCGCCNTTSDALQRLLTNTPFAKLHGIGCYHIHGATISIAVPDFVSEKCVHGLPCVYYTSLL